MIRGKNLPFELKTTIRMARRPTTAKLTEWSEPCPKGRKYPRRYSKKPKWTSCSGKKHDYDVSCRPELNRLGEVSKETTMIATTLQSVSETETNFSERENHSPNRIPKEITNLSCPNGMIKTGRNELKTAFIKQYMKYLWDMIGNTSHFMLTYHMLYSMIMLHKSNRKVNDWDNQSR